MCRSLGGGSRSPPRCSSIDGEAAGEDAVRYTRAAGGDAGRRRAPMARRKPIIGLVGGIGSGKSFVANELQKLGGVVIDSDRLNHEILNRPAVLQQLRDWWGSAVANADGTANRKAMGEIVC